MAANVEKLTRSRQAIDSRKERREKFLDAAAEVLAEQGLRDTTMDQIADHIDVSKVVLYRHFASKEDLIHSILERIAEKMLALDAQCDPHPARQGEATLQLARENRAAFIIICRDARNDPTYGAHYQQVHEAISSRLRELMLNEGVDSLIAHMCAETYTDTCLNGALNWLLHADPARDDEYGEWLAEGVLNMCRAWRARARDPQGFHAVAGLREAGQ
ncbi:TetR/AcrR family transcriptional regulator [Erythrobacter sp. HL-111]|uniref:TetR/AcrR family transcriptional regulator n=1 Tax=Erythrobacter sp. HL-111 TaxID=1798193 RepID=UPI0006DA4A3B|nr:TetR/AcrR family transcriptional regulator [Erythrobacter sp. HL-111]KPP81449.1 MAG: TetR family transcriptional regulator [Erythrobacteraceae bacterium HL-111]SDS96423.1 transcriptional regulator, TetR family [Erythrobacter sp. HL-111]